MTEGTTADHVHRARLYKLASLAFDRPIDEVTEAMTSGEFDDQLVESAHAIGSQELCDHAEAVAAESPSDEAEVDDYYSDWATLFGFEEGGEIQQYQIEYSPGTLVTSTDTLADISGFYKAFDLSLADGKRDRVDHLCLQLKFLSHLSLQTAYLVESDDPQGIEVLTNAQADFIEDHLGRWIPRYRDTVLEESDVAFYQALAELVATLVDEDTDRFGVEPSVFPETPPEPATDMFGNDDGDFRCGTCGSNPSAPEEGPAAREEPQPPRGDRNGPY